MKGLSLRMAALSSLASLGLLSPAMATSMINWNSTIDGVNSLNQTNYRQNGTGFTAVAGQDMLNDFSLYAQDQPGNSSYVQPGFNYYGYVYQLNRATNTIGSQVFASSMLTEASNGQLLVNTGNLNLVDGQSYYAFITTVGYSTNQQVAFYYARSNTSLDADGESNSIYVDYINDPSQVAGSSVEHANDYYVNAFTADFNNASAIAVPEPSNMLAMMGLGFLGLVGYQAAISRRKSYTEV